MKQFKKSIIVITLAILIISALAYVINAVDYKYENKDGNKIVAKDRELITLTTGAEVEVVQNPDEKGDAFFNKDKFSSSIDKTKFDEEIQLSILNQPNVWCVQRSKDFEFAKYKVGKEISVTDPVLAYILAGPEMGELRTGYPDKYQVALWR